MQFINKILWAVAAFSLIYGGIYLTFKSKFVQFRFIKMFKSLKKEDNKGLSPFKILSMSLAARIGVGSLAGIALAIYLGGPGSIFWILLSAIIVIPNSFFESSLGVIYNEKDGDNHKGGPAYYIRNGLNNKKLANLYAIIIIFAYIVGFLTIQSNTITASLSEYLPISKLFIGIIIALLTFFVIYKGVKSIANITSFLVPIMSIIYLLCTLFIIIKNINIIPDIFLLIIKDAFNIGSFSSGILATFFIGMQRGIFASEAGLGSGAIASAATNDNDANKQGYLAMLGVYFTVFIVCLSTAIIILSSDFNVINFKNINGIELTNYALNYHLGSLGSIVLIISIIFFAFSTIITGYYYGEINLKFLLPKIKNKTISLFKVITCLLLIVGSVVSASFIWNLVDILVAVMAIINIYAIIKLSKDVLYELKLRE